jgi:hypothetical protein
VGERRFCMADLGEHVISVWPQLAEHEVCEVTRRQLYLEELPGYNSAPASFIPTWLEVDH